LYFQSTIVSGDWRAKRREGQSHLQPLKTQQTCVINVKIII
jgi:hypothetical protein